MFCYSSFQVVHVVTLDKRETERKSPRMEKAAFQLGLDYILEKGLNVTEVVTDAHLGITALMSVYYSFLPIFIIKFKVAYKFA